MCIYIYIYRAENERKQSGQQADIGCLLQLPASLGELLELGCQVPLVGGLPGLLGEPKCHMSGFRV